MQHPAEREAERLRVILTAMTEALPDMTLSEAAPIIFATEKKTAELERQQVEAKNMIDLPNQRPETIAAFIDLQPDIADLCVDKKINAIKEVRSRATWGGKYVGLKEAKEGVEFWVARGSRTITPSGPRTPAGSWDPMFTTAEAIEWVDLQPGIVEEFDAGKKINAIKECRALTTLGLKEAKDLVERWAAERR